MMKLLNKTILFTLFTLISCKDSFDQFSNDPFVTGDNKPVVNRQLVIPTATRIELKNGLFYIEGENFNLLSDVKIRKPNGVVNDTAIYRKTDDSLIAGVIGDVLGNALANGGNLILELLFNSAQGQSVIPVNITVSNNSVSTNSISNQAVTGDKIAENTIPLSKLSNEGANPGFVITYVAGQGWRPGPVAGGAGGVGISTLNLGKGIETNTNEKQVNTGTATIQVDETVLRLVDSDDDGDDVPDKVVLTGNQHIHFKKEGDTHASLKFYNEDDSISVSNTNDSKLQIGSSDNNIKIIPSTKTIEASGDDLNINDNLKISDGKYLYLEGENTNRIVVDDGSTLVIGDTNDGDDDDDITFKVNGKVVLTEADLAEYFKASEDVAPGSVVGIDLSSGLARRYRAGDFLLGIVSTRPGFLGNQSESGEFVIPVALVGQVPFNKNEVVVKNRLVYTKDNKRIGVLLASGRIYLNLTTR